MLVLLVAFGGPLLKRSESFSTSSLASWRRSNWIALALVVGAALLALTGKSGGQGALILALLPVAWVLVNDRGILQGGKPKQIQPVSKQALEPATTAKQSPESESASGHTRTASKAATPLVGSQLLDKMRELGDIGKSDLVRACGYASANPDGGERLNFTAFYEALLEAKGAVLESPEERHSSGTSHSNTEEKADDRSLPDAEDIARMVNAYLDEIIDQNIDDFDSDGSYKVRPDYGYAKFYLDSVEGSYDMSLQGLIHYIMHEEDIYEEFLSGEQLTAVQECIDEYPEAIYSVDTTEGNGEEVETLLDEVYYRCICHVARRLKRAGLNVDAFSDFLNDDEDEETEKESAESSPVGKADNATSQAAANQQPPKLLNLRTSTGPFSISVIESTIGKPDDDGDISIDLKLSLSSYADDDVELVVSKLVVLTASGFPLLEREDEQDVLISKGSSEEISLYGGYFKESQIAGSTASDTQVLVQLTPCACKFIALPKIDIESVGALSGIAEAVSLLPNVNLKGVAIYAPQPDDDGDCRLEIKGLIVNESELALHKVVVSISIADKNGREIDSTEWSEKVAPFSTVCIDTSMWGVKASRLVGSSARVSIKSFQCIGNQELSWSVGCKPEPIEADLPVNVGSRQDSVVTSESSVQPSDKASTLVPREIELSTCNAFDLAITSATYRPPDDDGDTRYEAQYSVTNRSGQAIELLMARLFVLHPSGLVLATTEDESEDMAENGESISASSSTWGTSVRELDGDPRSARLLLQVTGCSCNFQDLGAINCPGSGSTATLRPVAQNNCGIVVEAITVTSEPPDDGECCLRFKALIRNQTNQTIPRAVLSTKLVSSSGRELEDTYTQEEIAANSLIVIEDSFWGVKEKRISSANLQFNLKAFAAVGTRSISSSNLAVED